MPNARHWFKSFAEGEWSWSGSVWIAFWFARMQVEFEKRRHERDLTPVDDPPSDGQFDILDAILDHPGDFLSTLECALFDYYNENAFGEAVIYWGDEDVTERFAPELCSPAEIWRLLRHPYISIPHVASDTAGVIFTIHFDCTWDREHGVCAAVRDWQIAADEVGQVGAIYRIFRT